MIASSNHWPGFSNFSLGFSEVSRELYLHAKIVMKTKSIPCMATSTITTTATWRSMPVPLVIIRRVRINSDNFVKQTDIAKRTSEATIHSD